MAFSSSQWLRRGPWAGTRIQLPKLPTWAPWRNGFPVEATLPTEGRKLYQYQRGGRGASSKKNILPHRGPLSLPNGARVSPQHWTVGRSFLGEPRSKLHRTPSMLTWHGYPAHSLSAQPAPPTGPAALPSDALGPLKKETTILECLSQATLKVCTHPQ
jgi:hypothetical protein